jgi:hypothetical protein
MFMTFSYHFIPLFFLCVGHAVAQLVEALRHKSEDRGFIGNRKSTTCAICWLKSVLHEEKRRTGPDSGRTNATKTVSDVFRHRSRTGKSYCRTRSDVGSERVKCRRPQPVPDTEHILLLFLNRQSFIRAQLQPHK